MLKSVTIENFFSFGKRITIDLNPKVNVLLGINGSGKTNFLRAIRLLYESVAGDGEGFEKIFANKWGGFKGVANASGKMKDFIRLSFEFDHNSIANSLPIPQYNFRQNPVYEIIVRPLGNTGYYLEENASVGDYIFLKVTNGRWIVSERDPNSGKIGLKSQDDSLNGNNENSPSFKTSELMLRQFEDPLRYLPLYTLKRTIESLAIYDYCNTSPDSLVRKPISATKVARLSSDGSNLTPLLDTLKDSHSLPYDELMQKISKINTNFKDISYSNIGSYLHLALREKNLTHTVQVEHISDGTLRYLMLSAIALNPERGYVLGIDEPENGLHPDMLNTVTNMLKDATNHHAQLILATHSPLVLNAFEVEDILIFEKTSNNESSVKRLDEEELEEYFDQYTLGQLWLMGKIGAKRW